ncbi:hypothetical protein [Endozoicomonas sp. Mp262]|uniref:protein YgfX n=1 Tax=Endozoicomonas sp. Mp262 TaxID=2919499 RepID=UPI0021D9ABE4
MAKELLEVNLGTSVIHLVAYALIHCAALLMLSLSALTWPWVLLLFLFQCVFAYFYSKRHIFRLNPASISAVRYYDGQWRINRGGNWILAWPYRQAFVSPLLICFNVRLYRENSNQIASVIIFPDSANPIQIHALRLQLLIDGFMVASENQNRYS